MVFDLNGKKVFVAGHKGMVGSALIRRLTDESCHILTAPRSQLDLRDQAQTREWFHHHQPDLVLLAAAKVGGIMANHTDPANFIFDNLMIQTNVIDAAYQSGVKRLVFLGSSCIYPKYALQPMKETELLSGYLEKTNEAYAIAKIAGIKMVEAYRKQYGVDYISLMPTNLYGPYDSYHALNSHVIPGLLLKFDEAHRDHAASVTVWGSGNPRREFLFVDDLADACIFLTQHYSEDEIINVGTGEDLSISELAHLIKNVTGFKGDIVFDSTKPEGPPRKLLDVSRLQALGWKAKTPLLAGLHIAYTDYRTRTLQV